MSISSPIFSGISCSWDKVFLYFLGEEYPTESPPHVICNWFTGLEGWWGTTHTHKHMLTGRRTSASGEGVFNILKHTPTVLQCVAVCCSVLQCLQCGAVGCSVFNILKHTPINRVGPSAALAVSWLIRIHAWTMTHTHSRVDHDSYSFTGAMWWLRLVGSLKLYFSFAKDPYKRNYILQKRPIFLRSLLLIATPYPQKSLTNTECCPFASHSHMGPSAALAVIMCRLMTW